MEQNLLQVEKDLVRTLKIVNKQFKVGQAISQQKDDIQQFVNNLVNGLINNGKITFWAHDQEVILDILLLWIRIFRLNIYVK